MKHIHFIFLLLSCTCFISSLTAASNDFKLIKERVVEELLKSTVDDKNIESVMNMMNEDGSFIGINYDDLSRTAGFPHRRHTSYLVSMATAYKTKSSEFYKDKKVLQVIIAGLNYWVKNDFFGDNWHNNQISTPTNLVNLMLLIGDRLPRVLIEKAQPIIGRANLNASGARPSGDRIVIAGILAKNLLFIEDKAAFDEVIRIIEGEIKFSTGERGMQHDYSFHHRVDRVNNTSSYGYGKYANAFGEWSYYVAGTEYAFSLEKINQLVDYYLDGIYKQQVYGIYDDVSVKNRSITSKATFSPQGTTEIERLLHSTDYRKDELEGIMRLRRGEVKPSASFAKFFWQTEHFVFQRPEFYTTVRMFSTRNRNMEVPYNGPGKPTHHRADGTNYLMLKGDEYHNIWPVYDWQKISGTTILQKPELPAPEEIQKDGLTEFVGAVTDGMYGSVVFDFKSPHDMTVAKKSWFFFDEEYVCLGTGIQSSKNLPVVTTVNQSLLRSEVTVMDNNQVHNLSNGERVLEHVKWIHHDRVGYLFPEPSSLHLSNQTEQGRWSDITDQKNISTELVYEDVFKLWFDHGKRPSDGRYQYIVVPAVSEQELAQTSENNRDIEILSNTGQVQAVKHQKLGISQYVFYEAATAAFSERDSIELGSHGLVMFKRNNNRITELSVADPSRKLSKMVLTIPGIYNQQGMEYRCIPDNKKIRTTILLDLPRGVYAGKSVNVQL